MVLVCPDPIGGTAVRDRVRPDVLIHGPVNAEDLVQVPGTPWLLASGIGDGRFQTGSLHLVDTSRHVAKALPFADLCPYAADDAPDPALFSAHGMCLSPSADGALTLHVVNHGGRESIEIFQVALASSGAEPTIRWSGSVRVPRGLMAYSVAARPDGSFLVTASAMGKSLTEGAVYEHSAETGWQVLPGPEIPGANGIELSRDLQSVFVNSYFGSTVYRIPLTPDAPPRREISMPFMPDNIRLSENGKLHVAGHDAAPEDIRQIVSDTSPLHAANYEVSEIDPETLAVVHVLSGQGTPEFGLATSALVVNGMLWLGTVRGTCVAGYRLPNEHPVEHVAD